MERERRPSSSLQRQRRPKRRNEEVKRVKTQRRRRPERERSAVRKRPDFKVSDPRKQNRAPSKSSTILRKILHFIFSFFFYVFILSILLGSTAFALNSNPDRSIFGYRFYNVITESMAPVKGAPAGGFRAGDMIIVKVIDGKEAKVNDIVTFQVGEGGSSFLTHRVIEKRSELNGKPGDYLITKGDANNVSDPPTPVKRVIGKKVYVLPEAGNVITFIREHFWISLVFVLSLFGFLLVLRYYFFDDPSSKKSSNSSRYIPQKY